MLRITELKLPIDHPEEDLRPPSCSAWASPAMTCSISPCSSAATMRAKISELCFIYTIDLTVRDEAALLHKFADDRNVNVAPDVSYKLVGQAPAT
jgi:hypothetical protein